MLITEEIKIGIIALTVISIFSLGFLSARKIYNKKIAPQQVIITERQEKQVIQADNSTILATNPVKKLIPHTIIPEAATIQSTGTLVLSPKISDQTSTTLPNIPQSNQIKPIDPIDVDLSIIKEKSGQERVIAKADGYNVSGSMDVPETYTITPDFKKQLLILYGYDFNTRQKRYGLQYSYKITGHVSVDAGVIGNIGFIGSSYQF